MNMLPIQKNKQDFARLLLKIPGAITHLPLLWDSRQPGRTSLLIALLKRLSQVKCWMVGRWRLACQPRRL